jgi:hypothetical protein
MPPVSAGNYFIRYSRARQVPPKNLALSAGNACQESYIAPTLRFWLTWLILEANVGAPSEHRRSTVIYREDRLLATGYERLGTAYRDAAK